MRLITNFVIIILIILALIWWYSHYVANTTATQAPVISELSPVSVDTERTQASPVEETDEQGKKIPIITKKTIKRWINPDIPLEKK